MCAQLHTVGAYLYYRVINYVRVTFSSTSHFKQTSLLPFACGVKSLFVCLLT